MYQLTWPACLLLLLPPPPVEPGISPFSSQEKGDREHGLDGDTYPHPAITARQPKQDDDAAKLIKVIDVNDDVDFAAPYTYAHLKKPEMPDDFTVCGAFKVGAWTIKFGSAYLYQMNTIDGNIWSFIQALAGQGYTEFNIRFGEVYFDSKLDDVNWFPRDWQRFCLSLDTLANRVVFVMNGEVLEEKVHSAELNENKDKPPGLDIMLGISIRPNYGYNQEFPGEFTNYNIFSRPLPTAKMVAMTTPGGDECGATGDYANWDEDEWVLNHKTKVVMKDELTGPCQPESKINVFTANFKHHTMCMQFCPKMGKGRSPPVRTQEEYNWLQTNLHALSPDIKPFLWMWLAATDVEEEGVWRDAYTQEVLGDYTKPWAPGHDHRFTREGQPDANCMLWYTGYPDETAMEEWFCLSYDMTCPCQYKNEPVLALRGICPGSAMLHQDAYEYTPWQLASAPSDMFFVGKTATEIHYNKSTEVWLMTSAVNDVTAECRAPLISYILGKHAWTVSNDVFSCSGGQTYTTLLKLSGCSEGEFTCDDGQCITMKQRCDQLPDCRDKSDEVDCRLMVPEESYNDKVPPITSASATDRTIVPVPISISISLLKIVSMQEVEHKIDFQFEISLEWKENRVIYHNLKEKTSLNALTEKEIKFLWLPYVIYVNTDMKEAVELWDGIDTTIVVQREGNFTRSGVEVLDEIEIFQGAENRLAMYQTYTKSFQCQYHLQKYPFDNQVCKWILTFYHTKIYQYIYFPSPGVCHRNEH